MSKEKIFCHHCQTQTKYVIYNFPRWHLKREHNMCMKEYYDLYIKKESEDRCKMCEKTCFWENFSKGYCTYCSRECMYSDPVYQRNQKESLKKYDRKKANSRRIKTCLDKYGIKNVMQTEEHKEKLFHSNMKKYGTRTTLGIKHVKEAREKAIEDQIEQIVAKRAKRWNNRTEEEKEEVKQKRVETCIERYGVETVFHIEGIWDKIRETNVKSGLWVPIENKDKWVQYKIMVQEETKLHIPNLFAEWDGKCYYMGYTLSNENGHYDPYSITIDHKMSKKYGYINNIDPKIIGGYKNLCICSRIINCAKNSMSESEFLESEIYVKYHKEASDV